MNPWMLSIAVTAATLATTAFLARPGEVPAQSIAWSADHRQAFVGDTRNGDIKALDLRNGIVERATLRHPERGAVLELLLDEARSRLWVRDAQRVYLYDAASLALVEVRQAPAGVALPGAVADEHLARTPAGSLATARRLPEAGS